jgi:hypothetical protein
MASILNDTPERLFGAEGGIPDDVRSNINNRLRRRAFEEKPLRMAVKAPGIPDIGRSEVVHHSATERLVLQRSNLGHLAVREDVLRSERKELQNTIKSMVDEYRSTLGFDADNTQRLSDKIDMHMIELKDKGEEISNLRREIGTRSYGKLEELVDDPEFKEGYSTAREGFITREEYTKRLKEKGIKTYGEYAMLNKTPEAHAPDVWEEVKRLKEDPNAAIVESRRGLDEAGDLLRTRRVTANKRIAQINSELSRLREVGGDQSRIRDLENRKHTLLEGIAQSGPGEASVVGGGRRLGKLANLARGIGTKTTKALGPISWIAEPFGTVEAIGDYASGDEDRILRATEFFQGLPELSTGRGLTTKEKESRLQNNLPWYDVRRQEGGI